MKKNIIIKNIVEYISNNEREKAEKLLLEKYLFEFKKKSSRQYSEYQKIKVFIKDGFVDRYSGNELIFPPVLRILSKNIPDKFPFHKNWKLSESHIAYWELVPTIDHVVPVSRGGVDKEKNWVCASQLKNSAKANWLLEELDWDLHKAGDMKKWDGLLGWFEKYVENNPKILEDSYILKWKNALDRIKKEKLF